MVRETPFLGSSHSYKSKTIISHLSAFSRFHAKMKTSKNFDNHNRVASPATVQIIPSYREEIQLGWNLSMNNKSIRLNLLAVTIAGAIAVAPSAQAQVSISNANLTATLSATGAISLATNNNPTVQTLLSNVGTRFLIRLYDVPVIDALAIGGINFNGKVTYRVGDTTSVNTGSWVIPPSKVGNHIEAEWMTGYVTYTTGTGGGTGGTGGTTVTVNYNPNIHVQMIISFVRNVARFQFTIFNTDTVPRVFDTAFVEDIDVSPTDNVNPDGPLRLKNQPNLFVESLLVGGQIPTSYETYSTVSTSPILNIHSIRGILKPESSLQSEPTIPNKMAYARSAQLSDLNIWDFTPNSSVKLGGANVTSLDASVALYYNSTETLQPRPVGASTGPFKQVVTYVGQAGSRGNYSTPLGLDVSAPQALQYVNNTNSPDPFTITATVANLLDLTSTASTFLNSGVVTATLQLPSGLELVAGETLSKQVANIPAGAEQAINWRVRANGSATGKLNFSVSAGASLLGSGGSKTVQNTVEVPAPASFLLKGKNATGINYTMISFPLDTSAISLEKLLEQQLETSQYDIVKYDPSVSPAASPYTTVKTIVGGIEPGKGYWIYSRLGTDKLVSINTGINGAKVIAEQVQPGAKTVQVNFPRGWNIIGDPYIYGIKFSDIQIFDNSTQLLLGVVDAADSVNGLISPAIWRYDTSDPDSRNWHYVLQDNLGFTMNPFEAFWVFMRKSSLTFVFNGVDAPGAAVTRAAGNTSASNSASNVHGRAQRDNWRLRLSAKGISGLDTDNFIGVAPRATDNLDGYKYEKPPVIGNRLSLELVNQNYDGGRSRYAQDLRSPSLSKKSWDLVVRSGAANEDVTLSWAELASSVPRDYQLSLIDTASNTRTPMRTRSTYTVNTGSAGFRTLTIEAVPTHGAGKVRITSVDVIEGNSRAAGGSSAVTINYTATQATETRILIRDRNGRAIRTLNSGTRATDNGSGSMVWDMKNGQGNGVAAGLYNIEVLAIGEDGQTARQTRIYTVTR